LTTNLPDVNFLLALSWKNHIHHHSARRWFYEHRDEAFATCPITESGFVRLSMNPAVVGEAVSFKAATAALRVYSKHRNHIFWPEDAGFAELTRDFSIQGYRQTTDAYLLGLAIRRRGRLVTFDRRIEGILADQTSRKTHLVVVTAETP